MKRRHIILLTLSAGAVAERYVLGPARAQFWAGARRKVKDAASWYGSGRDRDAAWRLERRMSPTSEEEAPF